MNCPVLIKNTFSFFLLFLFSFFFTFYLWVSNQSLWPPTPWPPPTPHPPTRWPPLTLPPPSPGIRGGRRAWPDSRRAGQQRGLSRIWPLQLRLPTKSEGRSDVSAHHAENSPQQARAQRPRTQQRQQDWPRRQSCLSCLLPGAQHHVLGRLHRPWLSRFGSAFCGLRR